MVDEHLNWKDHINIIEEKLSKNLVLLHRTKQFSNVKPMKSLHFLFIHSYLTYGNVTWSSTSLYQTKKLFSKQKQAVTVIPIADIQAILSSDKKVKHLDILNIYKLDPFPVLSIMFPLKTDSILETFQKHSNNTTTLQDTMNTISTSQIYFLGLLSIVMGTASSE